MNSTERDIQQLLTKFSTTIKTDQWQQIETNLDTLDVGGSENTFQAHHKYPYALTACAVVLAAVAVTNGSNFQKQLSNLAVTDSRAFDEASSNNSSGKARSNGITASLEGPAKQSSRALGEQKENPNSAHGNSSPSMQSSSAPLRDPAAGLGGAGLAEFPFYTYNHKIYSNSIINLSDEAIGKQLAANESGDGLIYQIEGIDPSKSIAVARNGYEKCDYFMEDTLSWNGSIYLIENPNSISGDPTEDQIGEAENHTLYSIKGVDISQRIRVHMEGEIYTDAVKQ